MNRIRRHVTFANAVSLAALFVALGGGAYAALGNNTIGSRQVKDGSIKSLDLKNRKGVKGIDVVDGSLTDKDIGDEAWAEVTPSGGVRKAHNISGDDIFKQTNVSADGVYCLVLPAQSVSATASPTSTGATGVEIHSRQALAEQGASPTVLGCPATTPWIVETFEPATSNRKDSYFQLLLHGLP
jgi:hypothetical protein